MCKPNIIVLSKQYLNQQFGTCILRDCVQCQTIKHIFLIIHYCINVPINAVTRLINITYYKHFLANLTHGVYYIYILSSDMLGFI